MVQIWLWDAFQWLQNDQLYRISTKFHPIWTRIRKNISIFDYDFCIHRTEGLDLKALDLRLGTDCTAVSIRINRISGHQKDGDNQAVSLEAPRSAPI